MNLVGKRLCTSVIGAYNLYGIFIKMDQYPNKKQISAIQAFSMQSDPIFDSFLYFFFFRSLCKTFSSN